MTAELLVFYLMAALLIASAVAMIAARNVVHAVLFMVMNFGLTGVVYLLLSAPFIAVVQVVVYAGAIMVLFLFVVMLLDQHDLSLDEPLVGQRQLAIPLVALLGLMLGSVLWRSARATVATGASGQAPPLPVDFGSPQMIGGELFGRQVLPFELVSFLLLAAMLGAVIIARFAHADEGAAPPSGGGEAG